MNRVPAPPVSERLTCHLIGPESWTEVTTTLVYNPADPFAVRVVFGEPEAPSAVWLLDRGLLRTAMNGPVGYGDVRMWPTRGGGAAVFLHLRAPAGEAMFELPREPVVRFLAASEMAVPFGGEGAGLRFDDELRDLTGGP